MVAKRTVGLVRMHSYALHHLHLNFAKYPSTFSLFLSRIYKVRCRSQVAAIHEPSLDFEYALFLKTIHDFLTVTRGIFITHRGRKRLKDLIETLTYFFPTRYGSS